MDAYEDEQQSLYESRKRFIENSRQKESDLEGYKVEYRLATREEAKQVHFGLNEDISFDWSSKRGKIYLIRRSGNCRDITPADIRSFDEKTFDLFEMGGFKPLEAVMTRKSSV